MAELSTEDRQRVWRGLMRFKSPLRGVYSVTKAELQQTVNETDAWIESNQASYNSALTYAAEFDITQKTVIFCAVALARASIDLLKAVFGRVD